ncbi:MAG: MFS transporter, partial [Hyphomicrobiaceae bacterium]
PRRPFLIVLDVVRAAVVLFLPFVDQVWQIYVLIFFLQSASAAFTPTFQATIPDILKDEEEYTKALSLSRIAYDLENLISPLLSAALLAIIGFHWLFVGTALGFMASALLVLSIALPAAVVRKRSGGLYENTTRGIRYYLATPRLRGLLSFSLVVAAAGAMVIVNSVVYVRATLNGDESDVAIALAVFGAGSITAALVLPRLYEPFSDRSIMFAGGAGLIAGLLALAAELMLASPSWPTFYAVWFVLGSSFSVVQLPAGRLLRRSSHHEDRPALFAAQFALSHACWLVTYPLAGWLGAHYGMTTALLVLAALGTVGMFAAYLIWPSPDADVIEHTHSDLSRDHGHWSEGEVTSDGRHAHTYVIDDLHRRWPSP